MALVAATVEITWLVSLLQELKVSNIRTTILWCDNNGAATLAWNPVQHGKTKHIEIDIHFVHDKVIAKELGIRYVPLALQIANVMTKPLTVINFVPCSPKPNVIDSHLGLRGGY